MLVLFLLTCEMALKALVLPIFSPPLETDSAECMAVLAASSTPSLIFLPISVRVTSSRPCGHIVKTFKTTSRPVQLQSQRDRIQTMPLLLIFTFKAINLFYSDLDMGVCGYMTRFFLASLFSFEKLAPTSRHGPV